MIAAVVNFAAAMALGRRIDRRFSHMAPCEIAVLSARRTTMGEHLTLVILVSVFYAMYLLVGGIWMWARLSPALPDFLHWMMFAMLAACHMVMARVIMCANTAFVRINQVRIGNPVMFVQDYCTMGGEAMCCVVARHMKQEREQEDEDAHNSVDGEKPGFRG